MTSGPEPRWPDGPLPPGGPAVPVGPQPPPLVPRGLGWAFIPFVTLGWGTPLSFLYGSLKARSPGLAVGAAAYTAGIGLSVYLWSLADPMLFLLGAVTMTMVWVAGTANAFAVRTRVFSRGASHSPANDHAIRVAQYRRQLRADARSLAADDPALAEELRIGRPDLPRNYDDGGLVDVNHASAHALGTLPGMTSELVERIVRHRAEHGGFISVEELAVDVDLPPALLPKIKEYVIFLD
ncbi:ComEA family DNA-binding protein [Actinomadura rupiterrae]|uniref:ComEA family DNA-binding protein n=1 Tax=Actinomadura rupiterrae TaxID=559627 RepID=UPI0020A5B3A2|nr:helix-hairpin-helix domain-containing protein [Actinomadura rupiterrae]MCP2343404.1 DNA uptake protein ComE-like DNA-binding protein [Actinomadura rupiterrae]